MDQSQQTTPVQANNNVAPNSSTPSANAIVDITKTPINLMEEDLGIDQATKHLDQIFKQLKNNPKQLAQELSKFRANYINKKYPNYRLAKEK